MLDATTRQTLLNQLQSADGDALQAMEFPYLRSPDQDAPRRRATRSSSSAPARRV